MLLQSDRSLPKGFNSLTARQGAHPEMMMDFAALRLGKGDVYANQDDLERALLLVYGQVRLEFPTGPYGKQTWFVTLDAAGKVVQSEQVLTESNFHQINPGMAQQVVRNLLGRPGQTQSLARGRGVVWSYRYENPFCQWFQVEIGADKAVRSAGFGQPPECDRPNEIIIPN